MRSAQFLDNLNSTVRENPVAAGLIGLGLAWMIFGESKSVVRGTRAAAGAAKETMGAAADAATGMMEPAIRGMADQAQDAAAGMSDVVSSTLKAAGAKVSDAAGAVSTASSNGPVSYDSRWGSARGREMVAFLERQPVALAVVGAAVGAAIASAFPRTAVEDRLVGPAGEKLRETAKDAAGTVGDRMAAAVDAATDEAVAQNLTPEAAKEALRAGAAKVRSVATAGLKNAE